MGNKSGTSTPLIRSQSDQDTADAKEWIANFNKAQFLQDSLYNTLEAMTFRWMSEGTKRVLYTMEKSATENFAFSSTFLEAMEEFQQRLNDEASSEIQYLINDLYNDKYPQED